MKIHHNSEIDYLSIDFKDEIEAKSEYHEGIIVRYDKKGREYRFKKSELFKLVA